MIPCPSCGEMFEKDAHLDLESLETGAPTSETYANLRARCPNCGHEFDPA